MVRFEPWPCRSILSVLGQSLVYPNRMRGDLHGNRVEMLLVAIHMAAQEGQELRCVLHLVSGRLVSSLFPVALEILSEAV